MTTLYKPVLIESVEQAEALPEGTIATTQHEGGGVWRKRNRGTWDKLRAHTAPGLWTNAGVANPDAALVALVPIEAKEERQDRVDVSRLPRAELTWPARTRLVTPWEEA